eukprot:963367-Lingulodinium_polyedra.AAC.1
MNSGDTCGWAPVEDRPSPSGVSLCSETQTWWRLVVDTTGSATNAIATPDDTILPWSRRGHDGIFGV